MITFFNISGAMVYVDANGRQHRLRGRVHEDRDVPPPLRGVRPRRRLRRPVRPLIGPSISFDCNQETSMTRLPRLFAASLLCLAAAGQFAQAADYPTRPVKWVVPYPPAGTTDVLARIVAQWLTEKMGQPFVIENKPGARQQPRHRVRRQRAARRLHDAARQPGQRHQRDAVQEPQLQLHPRHRAGRRHRAHAQRDGSDPSLPVKTVAEFIAYCKANPGQDQHGVVGQRHLGAPLGRAVQVDDRLRDAARAVQGRRARAHRPDGRPGARASSTTCRPRSATSRAASIRALARHLRRARAVDAGPADGRRDGARLRGDGLVRHRHAEGHAARHHRQGQRRGEPRARRSEDARSASPSSAASRSPARRRTSARSSPPRRRSGRRS